MTKGLVVVALLVGAFGVIASSQATVGVALVGFACLLAVVARIAQAAEATEKRVTDSRARVAALPR